MMLITLNVQKHSHRVICVRIFFISCHAESTIWPVHETVDHAEGMKHIYTNKLRLARLLDPNHISLEDVRPLLELYGLYYSHNKPYIYS